MLELRVMLCELDMGDFGTAKVLLDDHAVHLSATSFQQQYGTPIIAKAWLALAEAVEARRRKERAPDAPKIQLVNG